MKQMIIWFAMILLGVGIAGVVMGYQNDVTDLGAAASQQLQDIADDISGTPPVESPPTST